MVASIPLTRDTVDSLKRNSSDNDVLLMEAQPPSPVHKKRRLSSCHCAPRPPAKTVRFASTWEVHEPTSGSSLTEEEANALYMSDADQKRIFQEISEILRKATAGSVGDDTARESDDEPEEGIDGLECILQPNKTNRAQRMRAALEAILKRQFFHQIDEHWLSNHYRPLLEESKRLARERAIRDEDEVKLSCSTTTMLRKVHELTG